MSERRVLAIGAHPDDIEILCAGTLALLRERGWNIALATLTPGDCGSATLDASMISDIRRKEAQNSAEILGASYTCLESRDFQVFMDDAHCRKVCRLIREVNPELVLTHSPQDYLADHEHTSSIVRHACFSAPVRNYVTSGIGPIDHIPHLYYFDPVEHKNIFNEQSPVSILVDISEVISVKESMLGCHASQRDWLRKQHGCDHYIDQMKSWSQIRGQQLGVPYAEGFRQHRGHAYPSSNLMAEILGMRTKSFN